MRSGASTEETRKPGIATLIAANRHRRYIVVPQAAQRAVKFPEVSVSLRYSTISNAGGWGVLHFRQYIVPGRHGLLEPALRFSRNTRRSLPSTRAGRCWPKPCWCFSKTCWCFLPKTPTIYADVDGQPSAMAHKTIGFFKDF
jgi:hypothetical protein